MKYKWRSITRKILIGTKEVIVDSKLEERVIREIHASGYHEHWKKPTVGLNVGRNNYTPDLELSVQKNGMTHRALAEIKPSVAYFNQYVSRRMRGVAKYYFAKLLFLYADKEKQWYQIDPKTGALTKTELPPPGAKPIRKLYNPISVAAPRIYSHRYKKVFNPLVPALKFLADFLELAVKGPSKHRKKYWRRTQNRRLR